MTKAAVFSNNNFPLFAQQKSFAPLDGIIIFQLYQCDAIFAHKIRFDKQVFPAYGSLIYHESFAANDVKLL